MSFIKSDSHHDPVSKDLLFFKFVSDVSGAELLQLEYNKAHRNAYGERMREAQEQRLERRLNKLCQMD